ncbi:hypothetical protein PR048_026019, partial [Dryococelus australis]
AALLKDVVLRPSHPKTFLLQKHVDYIASYGTDKDEYEFCMTEYLRMSGVYWCLTAIELMGHLDRMNKEEIVSFIQQCQDESGGISASIGHDPHILYTLSAVQILTMYDAVDMVDVGKIVEYVKGLQQEDGSFYGDKWGEVDTRFSFCSVLCLSLLGRLDAINVDKASDFVVSCMNFDGGFGSKPGSESHAGLIYCCVGMLSPAQIGCRPAGVVAVRATAAVWGLNGRPEKLPDVCYSWWVLSSLSMLGRLHWINKDALVAFILACQDTETGGFSDRPGDVPDPFHTLFGLAALSLLGDLTVKPVNPTYCMPQHVIDRLGLRPQKLSHSVNCYTPAQKKLETTSRQRLATAILLVASLQSSHAPCVACNDTSLHCRHCKVGDGNDAHTVAEQLQMLAVAEWCWYCRWIAGAGVEKWQCMSQ